MADRGVVGKPYEVTIRLYSLVSYRWRAFDGWCIQHRIDPLELSPRRFCNLIYFWCIERVQPDKLEEFEMMLTQPLPGRERRSEQLAEEDGQMFMALMGQVNGQ